jgi:ATP-dependent DNA helicase PIF1
VRGFTSDGLPRVQFASFDGLKTIERHEWTNEESLIVRKQIPLRLAYALTIHKAQGASLDSALVDIGEATFEYGQAYVALSRVRSLEALFVHELDRRAFRVHKDVKEFYESLNRAI